MQDPKRKQGLILIALMLIGIFALPSIGIVSIGFASGSPPTQGTPRLVSSLGHDTTDEDLICTSQSTSDPEGDPVTNIYHWYKNDVSLTNLLMPFDTNSPTTATDYSGNGNTGTVDGATWTSGGGGGGGGGCYSFDGTNDKITIPDSGTLDGRGNWAQMTLEFWINPLLDAIYQTGNRVIAKRAASPGPFSYQVGFQSSGGRLYFDVWNDPTYYEVEYTTLLAANTWYHVVCMYNSGQGSKIYINGTDVNAALVQGSVSGNVQASIGVNLYVGSRYGTQNYFNGKIDDVRLYPAALSASQIYQHYYETKDGLSSSSTVVAAETTLGDVWKCEVTPNDGTQDGTSQLSNTLTIIAPATTHSLTVNVVGSGTVTKDPDKLVYDDGEKVTLKAFPASDWKFSGWGGDLTGKTNPTDITMDSDKTVTATFTQTQITVDCKATLPGVGEEFTVYINVTNVEDLYGWEFHFDYNPSILDLTYNDTVPGGLNAPMNFFKNSTNEATGHLWWAASSAYPTTTGATYADHAIFEIHFKGIAPGTSDLNLSRTLLADSTANPIVHTVVNGSVTVQTLDLTVDSIKILNRQGTAIWVGSIYANDTYADLSTYYYPVNVTIRNAGTFGASGFKVKLEVYYDTTLESSGEKTVSSLPALSSLELTFTDVLTPTKTGDVGRYSLKATVDSENVIPETDESNNVLEKKDFQVTVMGDTNGDRTVNVLDAVKLALAWSGEPGYPQWNVYADLNHDDVINILDGSRMALYWGTTW